jgi:exodeoxyribonuclease (lambda-induced)
MHEILAERMTGDAVPHVVTDAMMHGLEYEDEAVDRFVEMTGRDVQLSRFYKHPTIEYFGATPDREIGDGLLEVKCPSTPKFLRWKLAGIVPEEHRPQMLAQLACTGRKWVGFIAYDPRIKDERHQLFLAKFAPKPEEIAAVEAAAAKFLEEVEQMWEILTTQAA